MKTGHPSIRITRGRLSQKLLSWLVPSGLGCEQGVHEWSGKWTGCSRAFSKKLVYLCINLSTCAFNLLTVFVVNAAFCELTIKLSLSSLAWILLAFISLRLAEYIQNYSRLYALWLISRRRPPWELRVLWRGVLWGPCVLGDVLHSIACGLVEWLPRCFVPPLQVFLLL